MTADPDAAHAHGDTRPDGQPWIVVVNFGSHELVGQNFRAHRSGTGATSGVVVVDNYSDDAERAAITAVCDRNGWMLVTRSTNDGFAAACNAGVRAASAAGATSVLLVNPDAVVTDDVVADLARQLAEEPWTLVSPLIVTSEGAPYFRGSRVDLRSGRMRGRRWGDSSLGPTYLVSEAPYRDWLSGACLGFSIQLWERAGGLDERYFLYWEDVDFSQRCVDAGARLCLRRDLVVVHDEGGTHGQQGSRARSAIYYYYNCRNRLLYGAAHLGRRELLRWIWTTPGESWQILLRGGRRQLLESPKPLLATVLGSAAGLAHAVRSVLGQPVRVS